MGLKAMKGRSNNHNNYIYSPVQIEPNIKTSRKKLTYAAQLLTSQKF